MNQPGPVTNHPLDKTLEDKILHGEYVDLLHFFPIFCISPSLLIQFLLEDLSTGSPGSLLTFVWKKKPVVNTFHKWLDTFTSYTLVIVAAYPLRCSLELIKYQQIISKTVTKFKGLAWLSYDEQFRRRAAFELSIACITNRIT